ncbi:MAG: DEAD/DEAH box helicase [Acidobacteriota bacterium]
MSAIALRPYQRECLETLRNRYLAGKRRLLVALPTGTGKTVIFAQFPGYFGMKRRLLVLAHREELLDQAAHKFQAVDPALAVEVEQADRRAASARVVVASVPTLGREHSKRLARLDPEDFYLIVVDEAHHAVAPSYRRVFDHFGLFRKEGKRLLVGFTATPYRGDDKGLGEVFEEVAFQRDLDEMILAGYLCPVLGWRVGTGVDIDRVKVRAGDFVESQLAATVNVAGRNAVLIRAYEELARGRKCLIFCVDVAHARDVASAFTDRGHPAEVVWGEMAREGRRQALARFAAGATRILTNCNVLTEGFDEPTVDAILMARPTKSRLLYTQIVGRGTRLSPGKSDLVVIDVVDNTTRHAVAGLRDLFALPRGFDLKGKNALDMVREIRRIGERFPWVAIDELESPDDVKLAAERVDLFRFEPPEEISSMTRLAWCAGTDGYRLVLPDDERVVIAQNQLGTWDISLRAGGVVKTLSRKPELAQALRSADRWVSITRREALRVLDRDASWRQSPPTAAQLSHLRRLGIPVPKHISRGDASWMIAMATR